jgi:hypothetical protein
MTARFGPIDQLALRATLVEGTKGREALLELLDQVDFDNAQMGIWRLSPLLHARAKAFGIQHRLSRRIAGVARHIWVSNEARMRDLASFLDVVEPISPAVLIKGGATLVRFGGRGNLRPMGDLDILLAADRARAVVDKIATLGWHPAFVDLTADPDLPETTPGAPFRRTATEIYDLHWSPVHSVLDPELGDTIIAAAETGDYAGRRVSVPAMHHHIALLLVHADKPAETEVGRVDWACEAVLGLEAAGPAMDWRAFHSFARAYGLEVRLRAVLDDISAVLGRPIGGSGSRLRPMPLLKLEQRLRDTPMASLPAAGATFLAFQKERRSAGWRLSRIVARKALLRVIARTAFAGLQASDLAPDELAGAARDWAVRWQRRGRYNSSFMAGWSYPEIAGGRWTDGRVAALSVPASHPPGADVGLRLAGTSFVYRVEDRLDVAVNAGNETMSLAFDGLNTRDFEITIPARVGEDGRVTAGVGLALPERDPAHLELRLLGISLRDIAVVPLRIHSLPLSLELAGPAERPPELGLGWSSAGPHGTWTDGEDVFLMIRTERTPDVARFELEIIAIAPPGDAIAVDVTINGREHEPLQIRAPGDAINLGLPAGDLQAGKVAVHLRIRNPSSPAALGLGADRRRLGLHVSRIRVYRA